MNQEREGATDRRPTRTDDDQQRKLDEELADTFPTSDPPSSVMPSKRSQTDASTDGAPGNGPGEAPPAG